MSADATLITDHFMTNLPYLICIFIYTYILINWYTYFIYSIYVIISSLSATIINNSGIYIQRWYNITLFCTKEWWHLFQTVEAGAFTPNLHDLDYCGQWIQYLCALFISNNEEGFQYWDFNFLCHFKVVKLIYLIKFHSRQYADNISWIYFERSSFQHNHNFVSDILQFSRDSWSNKNIIFFLIT